MEELCPEKGHLRWDYEGVQIVFRNEPSPFPSPFSRKNTELSSVPSLKKCLLPSEIKELIGVQRRKLAENGNVGRGYTSSKDRA